jgi:tRNA pseudouridine38-40 synthase
MKYIKILLQYDGTRYLGWQKQKDSNTIQSIIENRLFQITGENVKLIGASRTDAGVHALGQVAVFATNSHLETETIMRALNSLLPHDIRALDFNETDQNFHPRYDAKNKIYFYMIANSHIVSPFLYRYVWRVPYNLDIALMKKAGKLLKGSHDFSAFRGSGCGAKTTEREIISFKIEQTEKIDFMTCRIQGNFIKITLEANAFLRYMVRNIVGTLVKIGRGKMRLETISDAFELKDRRKTGPTAPPNGLFLEEIRYPFKNKS